MRTANNTATNTVWVNASAGVAGLCPCAGSGVHRAGPEPAARSPDPPPAGARPWLGVDADATADRITPLAELVGRDGGELRDRLLHARHLPERFALAEAWLLRRLLRVLLQRQWLCSA